MILVRNEFIPLGDPGLTLSDKAMGDPADVIRAYEKLVYPVVTDVTVLKTPGKSGGFLVESAWSYSCPKEKTKLRLTDRTYLSETLKPLSSSGPQSSSDVKRVCVSPSGALRAVLREPSVSEKKACFLEVWNEKKWRMELILNVTEGKQHGSIYIDDRMGGMAFTPDEQRLIYVAERYREKGVPYMSDQSSENNAQKGSASIFVQSWGEQMTEIRESVVAIANIETGVIETVPPSVFEDPSLFPGEFVVTSENVVVGVVYKTKPFKLGAKFCYNRATRVYLLPLKFQEDGRLDVTNLKVEWVSGLENFNVWSLRLAPHEAFVVFLAGQVGGTHQKTSSLHALFLNTKKVETIVPVADVWDRATKFAGFYVDLPKKCFARFGETTTIVFHTPSLFSAYMFAVDVDGKSAGVVRRIETDEATFGGGSWKVHHVDWDAGFIVGSWSDCCSPAKLYVSRLPVANGTPEWIGISDRESSRPSLLEGAIVVRIILEGDDQTLGANAVLIFPGGAAKKSVPLVCFPHGGPHSVFLDEYTVNVAVFVACGFAVLLVNYRGSLGCGERFVRALPGKIGTLDVSDCHAAVKEAVDRCDVIDPSKLVLFGGSHGGFLVLQLAGQFPDTYKCVVARNPVTNLPAMLGISDIPDWVFTEAGWTYRPSAAQISPQQYEQATAMSPVAHIDTIRCPVLFQVGLNDIRVPPSQSFMVYYALKARNVETTLRQYDDNHSLEKPDVHPEVLISSILWFREHLSLKAPTS